MQTSAFNINHLEGGGSFSSGPRSVSAPEEEQEPPKKKLRERAPVLPTGLAAPTIMKGPVLATASTTAPSVDADDAFAAFMAEMGGEDMEVSETVPVPSPPAVDPFPPADTSGSDEKALLVGDPSEMPTGPLGAPVIHSSAPASPPESEASSPALPEEEEPHAPPPSRVVPTILPSALVPQPKTVVKMSPADWGDDSDEEDKPKQVVKEAWEYLQPKEIKAQASFFNFNSF